VRLEGTYTFEAPRQAVWEALMDPEVLAKVMPGCEKLEQLEENKYKGILNVKVGPVQGKFEGVVTITEVNPPEGYSIQVDGRGPAGFMKGVGQIRLEDQGETTLIHYGGDAQVGGRIASVGQRLLDTTAKSMSRQSLEGLHNQIKARQG
jgi:carbon monoxide dehydrogenase subunit G